MAEKLGRFHSTLQRILPGPVFRTLRAIEWFMVTIVLQRVLGTIALCFIYFLILGPTSLVTRVFFADALRPKTLSKDSNWIAADGYNEDIESAKFQS